MIYSKKLIQTYADERVFLKNNIELLQMDVSEIDYLNKFKNGLFLPQLLFEKSIALNAKSHPMANWKIKNISANKNK